MYIKVNVKQIGSRRKPVAAEQFFLSKKPETVREMIVESVRTCVEEYNERMDMGEEKPLEQQQIDAMSQVGKITFGMSYNGKKADFIKAAEHALISYEDGMYKIFVGNQMLEQLEDNIEIREESEVTFIRLTMLTGTLW